MNDSVRKPVYCPSCAFSPLETASAGWICKTVRSPSESDTNPFDESVNPAAEETSGGDGLHDFDDAWEPEKEAGDEAAEAAARNRAVPNSKKRKVCGTYNPPESDVCQRCNNPRHRHAAPVASGVGLKERLARLLPGRQPKVEVEDLPEVPIEGGGLWEYACPICRAEVPRAFFTERVASISFVAPEAAGKTHHMVSMHRWWSSRMNTQLTNRARLRPVSAMTPAMETAFHELINKVFGKGIALRKTDQSSLFSFCWRFTPAAREDSSRILSFHDSAGENFMDIDKVAERIPFVNHCDALIVILDGNQLRSAFPGSGGGGGAGSNGEDMHLTALKNVLTILQRENRDLRDIPVALCVNKIDLLQGNKGFRQMSHPDMKPQNSDRFDHRKAAQRSKQLIEGLLRKPQTHQIVSLVQEHFPKHMAFPMATLGCSPRDTGEESHIPNINLAYCVEDPLLWLLWQWGMVPPLNAA